MYQLGSIRTLDICAVSGQFLLLLFTKALALLNCRSSLPVQMSRSPAYLTGVSLLVSFYFFYPQRASLYSAIVHVYQLRYLRSQDTQVVIVFFSVSVTCICRDTGMCHYFGYFFGVSPGSLGTFLGYFRILGFFGYHLLAIPGFLGIIFLVKFNFFKNNPDFGVLILIFPSMTLWNVACRALVSYFFCRKE